MSNQEKTEEKKLLSREDRLILAQSYFGWYTFGMATTESERVDENCAMDNGGVPIYEDQLTDKHKEVLKKYKSEAWKPIESLLERNMDVPLVLDDEQVAKLKEIIYERRFSVGIQINNPENERFELYTWDLDETTGMQGAARVLGKYPTRTAAEKEMEGRSMRAIYAAILRFQLKATLNVKN